ncbi:hypothetical protein [Mycobacterium sp. 3519A]|uniref:hypothetical protein n=1 Tax=Mycobacterium sp. 3519A TaxID=2057184 RepID=UPI000C7B30F9|nr:hypothetical protein [Mycobacterium sp. 3519A]
MTTAVWDLILSVALLYWAGRMRTEARRVQSGWIGRTTALWSTKKSRSGTHERFAKTCRRGLAVLGGICVCIGAVLTLVWSIVWLRDLYAAAVHNEFRAELFTDLPHVFFGLAYLAFGAVAIDTHRALAPARQIR